MKPILKPNQMLSEMMVLSSTKHLEMVDKAGMPYILHPIRVMNNLHTKDLELMTIAIGHDLLEDTDVTVGLLINMGFSNRVITALTILNHLKDESYEDYIERICSNYDAILVKMADIEDNSRVNRLKGVREKDFKRFEKYARAYVRLEKAKLEFEQCIYKGDVNERFSN